ncbi:hypothetical protein Pryu01_01159 [Paraliobacillus ryukyuensis]|uniref:Uncharacterized protein n=1 Tax=Paraliobacillus ryukyuensis TaxID=200904 RepID=A0A366EFS8_9BACI|nr:hypothetical protein [Paraliobacillus ryukyuensis]RBP00269.1 hypothetical protein DES48_10229 [Paraliobacillus ryukyuensis]
MKKKSKVMMFSILFAASIALNLYLGFNSYLKSTYSPNQEDQQILGEMTKMVLENKEYKEIAARETVSAIKQEVSRFNVADPASIYHYQINVQTNEQSYLFFCIDDNCTDVTNEGWMYSRYSDVEPILPLHKEN